MGIESITVALGIIYSNEIEMKHSSATLGVNSLLYRVALCMPKVVSGKFSSTR